MVDFETGEERTNQRVHISSIVFIEISNNDYMVSADSTGKIAVWNIKKDLIFYNEFNKQCQVEKCIFFNMSGEDLKKDYNLLFFFGGSNGFVYLANEKDSCMEICKVGGAIKALL